MKRRKWWVWGMLAVLGLSAAVGGAFAWLRGSLPQIDGERTLTGLVAPVEVVRDVNGIPHITATNEEDALFALGFVHAQDRMWQMEMNRRIGAGRLAEVLGAAALDTDRLLRVLGLHHRAKASLGHFRPDVKRRIAAYVRGVNAWMETRPGPLPPEFLGLGFEPEPWSAADSVLLPKLMSLDLAREWTRDRMRLRLSEILPPDQLVDFYPPYRADKPRGVVPARALPSSAPPVASSGQAAAPFRPAPVSRTAPEPRQAPAGLKASGIFPLSGDQHVGAGGGPGLFGAMPAFAPRFQSLQHLRTGVLPARGDGAFPIRPRPADRSVSRALSAPTSGAIAERHPASAMLKASEDAAFPVPSSYADRSVSRLRSALSPLSSFGGHLGSNSWVVDGSRTASGKPLLANDPHLGLTAPSVWYLAHLSWPGVDVVGATLPGMPGVVLGHNGRVAWGFTNTGPDVQDLFLEQIDPSDPLRYATPEGWRAFDVRRERIRVRDGENVVLEVRESRHGPILDDTDRAPGSGDGAAPVLALAWTALRDDDLTLQAGLGVAHARDWPSFVTSLRDFHSPQQNITYADVDGNIGFLAPGLIPIRGGSGGERPGTMPRPGWEAGGGWQGFVPFEALPRVYNPPGGAIVTANHQVVPDGYPHHLTFEWAAGYRAQRIMEKLAESGRHDLASFRALQQDRTSLFARALLPWLRSVAVPAGAGEIAGRAQALLDGWEGSMDPDRPEPLVFQAWIWEFARLVSADELGVHQRAAWGRKGAFVQRVLEGRNVWCDDIHTAAAETCEEMLVRALVAATSRLAEDHGDDPEAWRWGHAHVAIAEHRPFGATPLAPLFNLSGPAPGSIYAVNAFSFGTLEEERPFASTHGPSFRAIYDLADLDRSLFVQSTGQSGNIFSPWYRNLERRWRDGGYILIPTERAAYEPNAVGRLRLTPYHG